MNPIQVGILGAGGFTGQELTRLLGQHPHAELKYITSSEYAGKRLVDVFPAIATEKNKNLVFSTHPEKVEDVGKIDVMFLATPDEVSLRWAPIFLKAGIRVVDISGAFRLEDTTAFKEYYALDHNAPEALQEAVYGLPEIYREKIRSAKLVANPGCYPTGALLPLYVYRDLIDVTKPVIIDAKSGSSGAGGRKEKDGLGYSTVYENFRAYKTEKHQHAPEIQQQFKSFTGEKMALRFTPHLLPMYRGILSCIYAYVKPGKSAEDFIKAAEDFSKREKFARFRANLDQIELRSVQHTNFCDYAHFVDASTGLVEIISAIDNLMKGAAGQAIQNMNLMFGFDENCGVY